MCANVQRNGELSRAISPPAGKRKKGFQAIMKFCLEGVYSDVLKGSGHMTFHAKFYTVGVNE